MGRREDRPTKDHSPSRHKVSTALEEPSPVRPHRGLSWEVRWDPILEDREVCRVRGIGISEAPLLGSALASRGGGVYKLWESTPEGPLSHLKDEVPGCFSTETAGAQSHRLQDGGLWNYLCSLEFFLFFINRPSHQGRAWHRLLWGGWSRTHVAGRGS